jgi:hypothetical protein
VDGTTVRLLVTRVGLSEGVSVGAGAGWCWLAEGAGGLADCSATTGRRQRRHSRLRSDQWPPTAAALSRRSRLREASCVAGEVRRILGAVPSFAGQRGPTRTDSTGPRDDEHGSALLADSSTLTGEQPYNATASTTDLADLLTSPFCPSALPSFPPRRGRTCAIRTRGCAQGCAWQGWGRRQRTPPPAALPLALRKKCQRPEPRGGRTAASGLRSDGEPARSTGRGGG